MLPHGSIYHFIPFLICLSVGVPASPLVGQIPPPSHNCIRMALGISYDCPSVVEFKKIDRNFNNLILRNCDGFEGVKFDTVRGLNLFCPEWKELPKNALAKNRLDNITISSCSITHLQWQRLPASLLNFNVSACPLACDCQNYWLLHYSDTKIIPPANLIECDFSRCQLSSLHAERIIYDIKQGESLNVTIRVDGDIFPSANFSDRKYFIWAHDQRSHSFVENITDRELRLYIKKADGKALGLVGAKCWHCVNKNILEFKIQIPVKIQAEIEAESDTLHLKITGYPLENITLTLRKVYNGTTGIAETHVLQEFAMHEDRDAIFINRLRVRPEDNHEDMFYQRKYSMFTTGGGDHAIQNFGNYSFEICSHSNLTDPDCTTLYEYIGYVTGGFNEHDDDTHNHNSTVKDPFYPFSYPLSESKIDKFNNRSSPSPSSYGWLFYFLITSITIILSLVAVFIHKFYWTKLKRKYISLVLGRSRQIAAQRRMDSASCKDTEETVTLQLDEMITPASKIEDYVNRIIPIIDLGEIKLFEFIGKGIAGKVYRGELNREGEEKQSIAVKVIENATEELRREARLLTKLNHPNIVKMHGITFDKGDLLLVFEMMRLGDLRNYLKARKPTCANYAQFPPPLNVAELKSICYEIGKAVHYLRTMNVLHRDIAARNILVDGESDQKLLSNQKRPPIRIKLSDFGMSRTLYGKDYYRMPLRGNIPIRWLPPEALTTNEYTHQSDMWALGVTFWEVFTYGSIPHENIPVDSIAFFMLHGLKPNNDPSFPPGVYDFLLKFWESEPKERITSDELMEDPFFDEIRDASDCSSFSSSKEYGNFDSDQESSKDFT